MFIVNHGSLKKAKSALRSWLYTAMYRVVRTYHDFILQYHKVAFMRGTHVPQNSLVVRKGLRMFIRDAYENVKNYIQ